MANYKLNSNFELHLQEDILNKIIKSLSEFKPVNKNKYNIVADDEIFNLLKKNCASDLCNENNAFYVDFCGSMTRVQTGYLFGGDKMYIFKNDKPYIIVDKDGFIFNIEKIISNEN